MGLGLVGGYDITIFIISLEFRLCVKIIARTLRRQVKTLQILPNNTHLSLFQEVITSLYAKTPEKSGVFGLGSVL